MEAERERWRNARPKCCCCDQPKAGEITRKWYVIDAAGKPMGKVAVEAARLLRGKHKPIFTPHADCGDHVIIKVDKVLQNQNRQNHQTISNL